MGTFFSLKICFQKYSMHGYFILMYNIKLITYHNRVNWNNNESSCNVAF
jgi:hypothetical protein